MMNHPGNPRHHNARLAACLLVAMLVGCRGKPPVAETTASMTVTSSAPIIQDLDQALVVSGSVAAWQEMSLGSELTGKRVAEVLVEVGDPVRGGQPLLRLDARTLAVQARQADAALAQARANLMLARSDSKRGDSLLERKLISISDADQLKGNLIRAEAQLSTAEADRDSAHLQFGFATLVAPHAGVISARSVQPGQVVSAGTELLRLIRDARLEWRAELAEKDLALVRAGTPVVITGPTGDQVSGQVRAVAPALDPQTRTGLVYADLPQPGTLRAGMFAQGRVTLGTTSATVLPREAVTYRDGLPYVFVLKAAPAAGGADQLATAVQRRITVGIQQGSMTELTGGIAANERVAVIGAGFLSDGDLVKIAPAAATAGGHTP
jgi:RND family efflux transporter MFP subunit